MLNTQARQKAFLLTAMKCNSPERVEVLLKELPQNVQATLMPTFEKIRKYDSQSLRSVILSELKKMSRPKSRSYLSEVHNDWIVDLLSAESPEMVSTILRYLPAERVQAVLDSLPQELLIRMPKMSETYRIPQSLVDLLRSKFENLFVHRRTQVVDEDFQFEHLCLLPARRLHQLFFELGYREIAIALKSLPEATRTIVISRLAIQDQKKVREYLGSDAMKASEQRIKKAQAHLVSQDIDAKEPALFIKDLGFLIYSKAILSSDFDDLAVIRHKISKVESKELSVQLDKYLPENTEASVVEYRDDILTLVKRMLVHTVR